MAHLVGIDKGPVMDWTNGTGLDECYRKWKKQVEVLFQGPLNEATESEMQLHDLLEWRSWYGPSGQEDHWGQNQWWKQRDIEYILDKIWRIHTPQTNQLIAVVELKQLFQGTLSLEDFHTKAMRLVTQAGYEGDAKEQVLRDTITSGIASDKIRLWKKDIKWS